MVRKPGDGAPYTQFTTGGTLFYTDMPAELEKSVEYFAQKLPLPFLAVDFLHDGERFWLSEIELDASIMCPNANDPAAVQTQRDIIRARFVAYVRAHSAFLGA
jgi:glutathione synthase/RimK-type ligase-like ATP-grasp enzyme